MRVSEQRPCPDPVTADRHRRGEETTRRTVSAGTHCKHTVHLQPLDGRFARTVQFTTQNQSIVIFH